MKHNYWIGEIFISLMLVSCMPSHETVPKEVKLSIESVALQDSKLGLQGMQLRWEREDAFSVYDDVTPLEWGNFKFALCSEPGTAVGMFSGMVSYMPQRAFLYAFYPFQTTSPYSLIQHPVRVPAVQRVPPQDSTKAPNYFCMAAKIPFQKESQTLSMQFKVLNALWNFSVLKQAQLPDHMKSLEVHLLEYSSGRGFQLETTYDMHQEKFNVLASDRYVNYIRADGLEAISEGDTFRLVLLPSVLTGARIQFRLLLEDGTVYVYNRQPMDLKFESGSCYTTTLDASAPDEVWGDLIYCENMGENAVVSTAPVSTYTQWQKGGPSGLGVQYAGNTEVRSTIPSPSLWPYSGGNNIFFGTLPRTFWIRNIAVKGHEKFTLEWSMIHYGYYLYPTDMDMEMSIDQGMSWQKVDYVSEEVNGWQKCKVEFRVPAGTLDLDVRFRANEGSVLRMDDVRLITGGEGILLNNTDPSTWKYIHGEEVLCQNMGLATAQPYSEYLYPSGLKVCALNLNASIGSNYLSATKWIYNFERYWWIRYPVQKQLYDSIEVSFTLYSSSTGPRDFIVFHSKDLEGWKLVEGAVPHLVASNASNKKVSFKFYVPYEEKIMRGSELQFKIMPISSVAAGGGALSTTGTSRLAGDFCIRKME